MLMDAKPLFSSKGYSLLCPELTASHGEYAKGVLRSDLGRDTSLKYYIVNFSQFRRHASIDDFNRDIFTVGRGLLHMVQYVSRLSGLSRPSVITLDHIGVYGTGVSRPPNRSYGVGKPESTICTVRFGHIQC
jgi:hypothetical protein